MNKMGSATKVKLNSFDDLFGTEQPQAGTEQVQEIVLSELHEFKGHPFKVLDDEKMQETVESVREHGVLMPGIARPRAEGGYEIIAGHRRRHACEAVGLETMPMFIRNYTDDEATIIMLDSNIQREDILPSEKAKAYRMKYDAMKHQGMETEDNTIDVMDDAQAYIELIKENISYEYHMKYDKYGQRELYDELFEVICEVVCVKRQTIRVAGEEYPYELVKARFLKLNSSHLEYVIGCMKETTTKITNIKAYMVTALYNAPTTINHFYQQEVQHDMYGEGWHEKGIV